MWIVVGKKVVKKDLLFHFDLNQIYVVVRVYCSVTENFSYYDWLKFYLFDFELNFGLQIYSNRKIISHETAFVSLLFDY